MKNRLLLVSLLSKVGFQVREAENGHEAIEVFQEWQPHLIWMDMRMPVMDGYEATAKIRQLAGGKAVKIIALTAHAFEEQRSSIINAGCDAVLHKPFHACEIFSALSRYFGVKFIYQDTATCSAPSGTETTLEMLNKLPPELRQQLHDAAQNLDPEETGLVIGQIHALTPELADRLQNLLLHYQFDQLIRLCENTTDIK